MSGSARGRRLVSPPGARTRPTADRVREATFNALHSLGEVVDAEVVDLFAGSGALGIEALSRGARRAVFVESDPAAVAAIRENLRHCGVDDRAEIVVGDALRWCRGGSGDVDLALCDPPYAFEGWDELLSVLPARTAVVESDRPIEVPATWRLVREKRYGTTVVRLLRRQEATP